MVKRSKLLTALDAHKGRDYAAEKRKAQIKAAEKRKRAKIQGKEENTNAANGNTDDEGVQDIDENAEESKGADGGVSVEKEASNAAEEASASKDEEEQEDGDEDEDEEEEDDAEDESDVPLSDLEADELEDTIPHQRMTINNTSALNASTKRIALLKNHSNPNKIPFHIHNSLISSLPPSSTSIPDPNDDLTRELEFYRIARTATVTARSLLKKEKVPFTRPTDYFAEMVKSDEHMGRIKQKMHDDAAGKKASAEAKKLRDAKKFGKQVQVAKEQERAKMKRETLDKIKDLKRKRKGNDTGNVRETDGEDPFESIAVESAPTKDRSGRERGPGGPNVKRQKRDQKFGFGGKKRFSKSGDALSSGDLSGFSAGRMKGKSGGKVKSKRPGKSRRVGGK